MPLVTSAWKLKVNATIRVAPFTLPVFINLILRHLYVLLLQVNSVYCCTCPFLGLQAAYQSENTVMYQDLLLLVKNTVSWTQMGVCSSFPLSSFILFFFSYPLLSLGSPSPTRLFAFCSSWFLSHFPGGSTSSPIRVAAKQEMAKMRVLWEEGFLFLFLF